MIPQYSSGRIGCVCKTWLLISLLLGISANTTQAQPKKLTEQKMAQIQSLRVVILSTMLAEQGIGEWGFSALVEVDEHRILFDTGRYPDTVIRNARELGVDLSDVTDVVLSHHHGDHTGGLLTLREELSKKNPHSISTVHVAKGIFDSRRKPSSNLESNTMIDVKIAFEESGGTFIIHDAPVELQPGVWLTGPVPRVHPERNWSGQTELKSSDEWVKDTIPESLSLVINTSKGLVIISGCGHAGIINIIEYAKLTVSDAPAYAVLGGFHLFASTDEHFQWTSQKLREHGVQHFLGAHCTGIEAVYQVRNRANMARQTCVVAAIGSSFNIDSGVDPGYLAR